MRMFELGIQYVRGYITPMSAYCIIFTCGCWGIYQYGTWLELHTTRSKE